MKDASTRSSDGHECSHPKFFASLLPMSATSSIVFIYLGASTRVIYCTCTISCAHDAGICSISPTQCTCSLPLSLVPASSVPTYFAPAPSLASTPSLVLRAQVLAQFLAPRVLAPSCHHSCLHHLMCPPVICCDSAFCCTISCTQPISYVQVVSACAFSHITPYLVPSFLPSLVPAPSLVPRA